MLLRWLVVVPLVVALLGPFASRAGSTGAPAGERRVLAAWGENELGQVGDATVVQRASPVAVQALNDVAGLTITMVAAGTNHSLALAADGSVWAWGHNGFGQVGDGSSFDRRRPVRVRGSSGEGYLAGIVAVAAGGDRSHALTTDGRVWSWGGDILGALGDGGVDSDSNLPVLVQDPAGGGPLVGVVAIAAGLHHSLALASDGTVWAWGLNDDGQLGDGTSENSRPLPVKVRAETGDAVLGRITAIDAGLFHSLALTESGAVLAWGFNGSGELGVGIAGDDVLFPAYVRNADGGADLTGIAGIVAGGAHSLALSRTGRLWAWGLNDSGQLGTEAMVPVGILPAPVLDANRDGPLQGVVAVDAGVSHSLAITLGGRLWAWGDNAHGQLGNNHELQEQVRPAPVQDTNGRPVSGVVAIGSGAWHTLAIARPPEATLSAPAAARTSRVTVEVTSTGILAASGYFVGRLPSAPVPRSARWSRRGVLAADLGPGDGVKTLYAFTRDTAGHVREPAAVRVLLDSAPPSITIARPAEGARLTALSLLAGSMRDPSPASGIGDARFAIRWKEGTTCKWWRPAARRLVTGPCGEPTWVGLPARRSWTKAIGPLDHAGAYTLMMEVTDRAGNTGKVSRAFAIAAAGVRAAR